MAQPPTVQEQFEEVAKKYRWTDIVRDFMTKSDGLGAASLDDFTFSVATEAEIKTLVETMGISDKAELLQQTGRVRQAWYALRKAKADEEVIKARGRDDTDLDKLLPQPDLDQIADRFYARYRIHYPPFIAPSDLTISRIVREVSKRALTTREIWKVKTQAQMLKAERRKEQISDGAQILYGEAADDVKETQNVPAYLNKLFTLMLAYAMAGSTPVKNPTSPEKRGTPTTEIVEFPLDLALKYYHRAKRWVELAAPSRMATLENLQRRDEGEREMWIDYFRNRDLTLGCAVLKVYDVRESFWQPPEAPARAIQDRYDKNKDSPTKADRPEKRLRVDEDGKSKGKGGNSTPSGSKGFARQFPNGTYLCQAFQYGNCKNKANACSKGSHLCAVLLKNGRICGGHHQGNKCNNPKKMGQ